MASIGLSTDQGNNVQTSQPSALLDVNAKIHQKALSCHIDSCIMKNALVNPTNAVLEPRSTNAAKAVNARILIFKACFHHYQ